MDKQRNNCQRKRTRDAFNSCKSKRQKNVSSQRYIIIHSCLTTIASTFSVFLLHEQDGIKSNKDRIILSPKDEYGIHIFVNHTF